MTANPSYPPSFSFDPADPVFRAHEGGKVEVVPTKALRDRADLALLYTPGVADVSRAIAADPSLAARYTARSNTVAVITDGTAVLGLGDIGPLAALPVMEGKAVLFKHFAGVDAVPVCLETGTVAELVEAIVRLAPTYGGINLEDISAPRCFEIERQLRERLDIPVFHDDQHGTAIVVLAALINAAEVVDKDLASLRVVVQGAGAAGVAVAKILVRAGVRDVVVCDSRGIISPARMDLVEHKHRLAAITNPRGLSGSMAAALVGADVFIGVSGGQVAEQDLAGMAPRAIIFALANPDPEVHPLVAARYAEVVATGRFGLPEPDQQRTGVPGAVPGGARLRCGPDRRGDEAGRGPRDRLPGGRAELAGDRAERVRRTGGADRGCGGGRAGLRAGSP